MNIIAENIAIILFQLTLQFTDEFKIRELAWFKRNKISSMLKSTIFIGNMVRELIGNFFVRVISLE